MRVSSCNFQHELMKAGPGLRLRSHNKVRKGDLSGLLTIVAGMKDWWMGDEEKSSPVTNPSTSSLRNLICLSTIWLQSFGYWVNWGTDTHRWNEYPQRIGETAHTGPPSELQSQLGICSKLAVGVMGSLQDKDDRRWCWLKDSLRLRGCHAYLLQVLPCRKHYLGDHSSLSFRNDRGDSCPAGGNNMDLPWHDLVTCGLYASHTTKQLLARQAERKETGTFSKTPVLSWALSHCQAKPRWLLEKSNLSTPVTIPA